MRGSPHCRPASLPSPAVPRVSMGCATLCCIMLRHAVRRASPCCARPHSAMPRSVSPQCLTMWCSVLRRAVFRHQGLWASVAGAPAHVFWGFGALSGSHMFISFLLLLFRRCQLRRSRSCCAGSFGAPVSSLSMCHVSVSDAFAHGAGVFNFLTAGVCTFFRHFLRPMASV